MLKTKYTILIFCLSLFSSLFAQKGKDGAKSVSAANTKINEFTALTGNANAGNTILNVAASSLNANARFTSTLTAGDLVMVIQMQGAYIKLSATPVWAPDSTYGNIYSYEKSGNYEFAQVKSVISATQIELDCGLTYSYSSTGKTQVVRVPRYSSLSVTGTGTLTTDAWNGTIGGVLAAEVAGNSIVDGVITATGLGFRGGSNPLTGGSSTTLFSSINPNGGEKGEGIGSDRITNITHDSLGKYCQGAPGNGGGGGQKDNCGGGGGANGGSLLPYNGYGVITIPGYTSIWDLEWSGRSGVTSNGGGKGGYGTSTSTAPNVNTTGPNNAAWGAGFNRVNRGGFGGRPLNYATGKIFMGGGGGAGHMTVNASGVKQSNGAGACAGGNGGGLIFILNYGTISGTGTIVSNGTNGGDAFGTASFTYPSQGIDGAGGAGAGGTIILQCNGIISGITANANGGNGGNQVKSGTASQEAQGPGGGGGGGYIAGNGSVFTQNTNGGVSGTTNATNFDTEFPTNGATSGNTGTNGQVIAPSFSLTASSNQTLCTNQSANLTASSTNTNATISWYNTAAGGTAVATGTAYTTPVYASIGTYTVYAGSCPGVYRVPIVITVNAGATFAINNPIICSGQTTVLTVTTTATSYTWSAAGSPTTTAISVSPASTTIYTITGGSGACVGSQTTQVTVNTTPTVVVASQTICSGNSATLTASGATSYTWMPGAQTTTVVVVTPTTNTTYTITGANGTCTSSTTASVIVTSNPTVTVSNQTICPTQTVILTAGGATTYSWNTGPTTNTISVSPATNTTYTVTGTTTGCSNTKTVSVTIAPQPTVSVANATICSGNSATLTASGATSYTWMPGSLTTTVVVVTPTTNTTYTITGSNGTCTNTTTATVSVTSNPTVTVSNQTICPTQTVILTAGGATTYSWNTGPTTNTISVSPATNTTYTVTGTTTGCSNTKTVSVTIAPQPTVSVANATICSGNSATLTASGATSYTWMPGTLTTTVVTVSPSSNTTYTITGSNGTCTNTTTATVSVTSNPTVTVSNQTICPTQTIVLAASGATTYSWNTGPTTNTISVSPATNTTYTVTGTTNLCTDTKTVSVSIASQPTLAVANASICSGNSTTLTASGATSYTWMPGAMTTTVVTVSPTSNTTYTITGSNGTCTNTTTATVNVTSTPTITGVSNTTICPTQTATFTAGGAATYTWQPGSFVGTTYTIAPASNTTVSVIGANGSCTSSLTVSITIGSGISIAVNNPTICVGQTATLTASGGATSYTWSTGPNTNTISVSPASTTTYTISGMNGACSGSNTAVVTVVSVPSVTVSNAAICSGGTATLTASGATNYTWMPGGQLTTSITDNPASTTIYTITGSNGICSNSTTATVSVTATPTIAVASTTICPGQTATLTASGALSFTWNPGNVTGNTFTMSPASNTVVTIDGANGTCMSSTTASITIGSGLSIAVNNPTICPGETATLTASGAVTYTWNPGNLSGATVTVGTANTTTYTVVGANGACTGSNTAIVTVAPTPTLVTSASATICSGQTTTLTVSGATSYTWEPGTLPGASAVVTPTANTTYTVVGSNGTCTNSATSSITLINCNNPCQFSLGRDTAFCSPMNYVINGPAGYNSYSWTPGGATTQNITATNTDTYICTANMLSNDLVINGAFTSGNTGFASNYVVPVAPGGFGWLSNPGTYSITTNPSLAHVNFISFGDHTTGTGNMMVCNGSSVPNDIVWTETISVVPNTNYNFSAWVASVYNTTTANAAQLQFSINSGLIGPVYSAPLTGGVWSNFAVNWNSGVSTSAVITIVDQNIGTGGNDFALDDIFFQQVCSYSDTIIVTSNATPTLAVSATNSVICDGKPTTLTASGASTYTWTGGITNGTAFSPTATATYSVVGSSTAGCTNTAVQTITVNPIPTLTVTNSTICDGQTATISASGALTYTWAPGGSGSSHIVSPSFTSVYYVRGTDINGCISKKDSSIVTVNITPTVTVNSPNICAGQTTTLTANGASTYLWNTTSTNTIISVSPANTTTYSVLGSNGTCTSSATSTVVVTPSPTLSINASSTTGCAPLCINFTDQTPPSTGIMYDFGDGDTTVFNNPSHCFTASGNYTVTATCTSSVGCSTTYTLPTPIQVILTPVANFTIEEGNLVTTGTLVHLTNTSTNATSSLWDYCNGTSIATNTTTTYADTGSCCITLLTANATCTNSITKCISIVKEAVVIIPNVFTPNGDHANDVFKVSSSGLKSLSCTIFDRWGLKMYEWDGLNGYWDGNGKGGMCPDGTYFYIINYTDQLDQTKTEKGYLNLFKN